MLQFDHGQTLPIRSLIFDELRGLLADLVKERALSSHAWSTTETPYGPVLTDIVRLPFPASLPVARNMRGDARSFLDYLPKDSPAVAIYVGPGDDVKVNPSGPRLEYDCEIQVCYSSSHSGRQIVGRISPDPDAQSNVDDPGIDAIEDLIVPRLVGNGLISTSIASNLRVTEIGVDLADMGDAFWRRIGLLLTISYVICIERDAGQISQVTVEHDVQNGGIIYDQEID